MWQARGVGRRAAKVMSFLICSGERGRDVCPRRKCGRERCARCKRRDRATGGGSVRTEATKPTDEGGRAVAAPFLRLGRVGLYNPLCKNGNATGGRVLPPVERAAEGTEHWRGERDDTAVFVRSG